MRLGPPLLNISLTSLTSNCTSPTFLSPIDPSFSYPCPPTPSPPIASASHGHDIHPLTDILGSPALSTCSIHSPPITVSMRGESSCSGEGRSSTPTGGKYKCASTSPVLNNTWGRSGQKCWLWAGSFLNHVVYVSSSLGCFEYFGSAIKRARVSFVWPVQFSAQVLTAASPCLLLATEGEEPTWCAVLWVAANSQGTGKNWD